MANPRAVKEYDEFKVKNFNFKTEGEDEATKYGCVGKIEVESETKEITKKCEGETLTLASVIDSMTVKISGHVSKKILEDVYGIKTEGFKEGVKAYGSNSVGKKGALTFDSYDVYNENQKLYAFPNLVATTGLKWSIENGQEELAEVELEFKAQKDENDQYMYNALVEELKDDKLKEKWLKNFDSKDVVKKGGETPPPIE